MLNLRIMRKEGRDEELIGEGNVRIDGKSWREFDGKSRLATRELIATHSVFFLPYRVDRTEERWQICWRGLLRDDFLPSRSPGKRRSPL